MCRRPRGAGDLRSALDREDTWAAGPTNTRTRPVYGLKADELDTPTARKLIDDAAPINHITKDDPPVFLFYSEPKGPLPADAGPGEGIHHPNFGTALKEKLDEFKIECVVRHRDDYKGKTPAERNREMVAFLVKHLKK